MDFMKPAQDMALGRLRKAARASFTSAAPVWKMDAFRYLQVKFGDGNSELISQLNQNILIYFSA